MRGKVIVREDADIPCPNCDDLRFYYILTFASGTKKSLIEQWSLETKLDKSIQIEENCIGCGYHNVR